MQPTKHRDPRKEPSFMHRHERRPCRRRYNLPLSLERRSRDTCTLSPGLTCGSSPYLPPPLPPDPEPPEPILPPEPMLPEPDIPLECDCPPLVSRSEWDPDSNPYPVPLLDSGLFASPDPEPDPIFEPDPICEPEPLPPFWAFHPLPGTPWVPFEPV